jgi:hypothetical protein
MKSDIPVLSADSTEKYGFYDRLKAEFPSQILVDVAEVCDLAAFIARILNLKNRSTTARVTSKQN